MKDISDYMAFSDDGRLPKRSIKSIINIPLAIHKWNVFDSKYRDGNPSGKFVQMLVEIDEGSFLVNTGSEIIMATGNVVRILNRRSSSRIVKRLKRLINKYKQGGRTWDDVINCFNSWKSHANQGNSNSKVRRIEKWLKVQF